MKAPGEPYSRRVNWSKCRCCEHFLEKVLKNSIRHFVDNGAVGYSGLSHVHVAKC